MRLNTAYSAFLALLLTLVLTGCRREPLSDSGDVLRFTVNSDEVSSALTKADPTPPDVPIASSPGDVLRIEGNKIPVWGSSSAGAVFDTPFIELKCEGSGGSANWDYSGDRYYWNPGASYQFRSVFTGGRDTYSGDATKVTVSYTGYPDDYDLMVAAVAVPSGAGQEARLTFSHACSAVRFFCVDPSRGDKLTPNYTITSFMLKGVSISGSLDFDAVSTSASATVSGWNTDPPGGIVYSSTEEWGVPDNHVTDEEADLTRWLYFVPQTLGEQAVVEFTYRVESTGQLLNVTRKLNYAVSTWAPGRTYAFYITIQPTAIGFNLVWAPWVTTEPQDLI